MSNTRRTAPLGREGFTLVEILVAFAIIAILMGIAVPKMDGVIHRNRTREAANQIAADLAYTRLTAVRSGEGAELVLSGGTSYQLRRGRGAGATTVKQVSLVQDYPDITVAAELEASGTAVTSVAFDSRGMLLPRETVEFTIHAPAEAADALNTSLRITPLGNVTREF